MFGKATVKLDDHLWEKIRKYSVMQKNLMQKKFRQQLKTLQQIATITAMN